MRAQLKAAIGRFKNDKHGGIAIISGVFFMVAIGASALAIDVGSLYLEKRRAQSFTDLAAMAAAGDLLHAEGAARATLTANNIDLSHATVQVQLGHYTRQTSTPVAQRFQIGALPSNAVLVTLTKPGRIFFAKSFAGDCCSMTVTAMAENAQLATFSVGSRLASFNGGVFNGLLSKLLGGNVNFQLMDYNALVNANVKMFDFMKALATEVHVTGGTYTDVLNASATVGNVLKALATASNASGNSSAALALQTLLTQSSANTKSISLASLISLGSLGSVAVGDAPQGTDAKLKVSDVVSAAATLANTNKMVSVDLGVTIPGLLGLKFDVAIGDPPQQSPWTGVGQEGSIVRTAQTRIRLTADVGNTGGLANIHIPLYINLAYAEGRLAKVACAADGTGSVTVGVKPGIAKAYIGDVLTPQLTNFVTDASVTTAAIATTTLAGVPLIKVKAYSEVAVGNINETQVSFTQADINNVTPKTVGTRNLTQSLMTTLLGKLQLSVELPLGLGSIVTGLVNALVPGLLGAVATTLTPAFGAIDGVVVQLLDTLGLHLGEADVRVNGVRCGGGVLSG